MAEEDDIATEAFGVTTAIGGGIAAVGGVASAAAGVAVAGAAAVGVGIGMGIEYVTDGAISDTLSDGLLDLVGEEESLAAANAFDDGDYIEGVGHMLAGAGEHDRRRRLGRVRLRQRGRGGRLRHRLRRRLGRVRLRLRRGQRRVRHRVGLRQRRRGLPEPVRLTGAGGAGRAVDRRPAPPPHQPHDLHDTARTTQARTTFHQPHQPCERRHPMPQYLSPGVYVEELEAGSRPIEGAGTAVAAFVGFASDGPFHTPTLVTNWSQFTSTFGGFAEGCYLAHSVYAYFNNGGGRRTSCGSARTAQDGEAPTAVAELSGAGDGAADRLPRRGSRPPATTATASASRSPTRTRVSRRTASASSSARRGRTTRCSRASPPTARHAPTSRRS